MPQSNEDLRSTRERLLSESGGTASGLLERPRSDQASSDHPQFKPTDNRHSVIATAIPIMKLHLLITMFSVLSLGCHQRGEETPSVTLPEKPATDTRLDISAPDDRLLESKVELEFFNGTELNDLAAKYNKAIGELNEFEHRRSTALQQELELKRKLETLRGPRLTDLTAVDEIIRDLGGVQIRGSALSDTHVAAIIKLTESFAETKFNCESDLIVHDGHNKCHRMWRYRGGGSFAINLELIDGRWEMDSMTSIISCKFPDDQLRGKTK